MAEMWNILDTTIHWVCCI